MKKYLNSIFSIVVACLFITNASAITKIEYYSKLFRDWNISTDILKVSSVVKESTPSSVISSAKKSSNLLLMSSQLVSSNISLASLDFSYTSIFIICDVPFKDYSGVSCSYDEVSSKSEDLVNINLTPSKNIQLVKISQSTTNILFIPEKYVVSSFLSDDLKTYLGSYIKSNEASKSLNKVSENSLYDGLVSPKSSFIFEMFLYAVILFLFGVLFRPVLITLVRNPKSLSKHETYMNLINKVILFFKTYQWVSIYALLILFVFYIPLLVIVSLKDTSTINVGYMISYVVNTLNIQSLGSALETNFMFRIMLFFYNLGFIIFGLLCFLPNAYDLCIKLFQKVSHLKISENIVRNSLLFLSFIFLLMFLLIPVKSSSSFILLMLFISLFILIIDKNKNSFGFSNKEKVIFSFVLVITLVLGGYYQYLKSTKMIKPSFEELISSSNKIIVLPYAKQYGENILFNTFEFAGNLPVFSGDYLTYHPMYAHIEHKKFSDFSFNGSNFILLGSTRNKFIEKVMSLKDLISRLPTVSVSDLFYTNQLNVSSNSSRSIELGFNCNSKINPQKVKLKFYYYTDKINTEKIDVLNFPGCDSDSLSVVKYRVPLPEINAEGKPVLFEVQNYASLPIISIDLYEDTKKVDLAFLNDSSKVLLENYSGNPLDTLNIFSLNDIQPISFNTPNSKEVNLSTNINELMKKKLLSNPFLIWTSAGDGVILKTNNE